MGVQDVEAGKAFVTLYLRRTNYDQQIDDLKREEGASRDEAAGRPERPSHAIASGVEEHTELAGISRLIGYEGDIGNIIGLLRLLRDSSNDAAPALSSVGLAAATSAPMFTPLQAAMDANAQSMSRVKPLFGETTEALQVVGGGFQIFGKAVFAIPKLIGSAIGAIRKMPSVFSETADAAEKAGGQTTKAMGRMSGQRGNKKPSASRKPQDEPISLEGLTNVVADSPGIKEVISLSKKAKTAISSIVGATRKMADQVASSAGSMASRVVAEAGKIAKSLARMPGQIVKATSAAIKRVGVSLAKIGTITAGITAAIVGSATLAAKSWAAYGERIRGVQNDLLRFQLTAEEASIIARVSDQTGESMERLAHDMRDGTRDFSRWRNELRLSGTLMSGAGLAAALALSRAYSSLKGSVLGLKNMIGATLGPTLTEGAELFTGMVRGVTRWVSQNKPLVVQVFKIASAVGIAAGVITTLGGAIAGVGTVITPFTALLAAIAGGLAYVEIRAGSGRTIWAAYGASVQRVYETVSQYLGQMLKFADKVIGGVTDAVIAGDLATAVDVMWGAAKVVWFTALREIDEMTGGLFSGLLESLAAGRWSAAAEVAMNALHIAWLAGVNVLANIWDRVVDAADTAWTGILTTFDSMITSMKSGLAGFLNFVFHNVLGPLVDALADADSILGLKAQAAVAQASTGVSDARKSVLESVRADEEGEGAKRQQRLGESEERRRERQPGNDAARVAREEEITRLKVRQDELAKKTGAEAERERSKAQKGLDAAILAAQTARDAAAKNKLQESDFAVSQESQSIARFSGEALGLSVGRGEDTAEKAVKVAEKQLKVLTQLQIDTRNYNAELRRLNALGGFE